MYFLKKSLLVCVVGLSVLIASNSDVLFAESAPVDAVEKRIFELPADFDQSVEQALIDFDIPGIAIGVVANGEVILSKGYGIRDRNNERPVTENTLFAIGSCTKAFTTFVLGTLVDEGLIEWDMPVVNYIPEFRLWDQHANQHITVRDLVTHRSGLPRHDFVWYNSIASREELVSRLQYLEPVCDLREKVYYNSLMYITAGYLAERVTGLSWEDIVSSRIFSPLGMNESNFSVHDSQKKYGFFLPIYEEKRRSGENSI